MSGTPRPIRDTRITQHGTRAERRLLMRTGALIRQDASRVPVAGDKPGGRQQRRGGRP